MNAVRTFAAAHHDPAAAEAQRREAFLPPASNRPTREEIISKYHNERRMPFNEPGQPTRMQEMQGDYWGDLDKALRAAGYQGYYP